jgi:hypothetical protein
VGTPTNEPDPFGTPAPPGQAPLPGQFGEAGVPGPGYPAAPEQSQPTQTAPVFGEAQAGAPYAVGSDFGQGSSGAAGSPFGPGGPGPGGPWSGGPGPQFGPAGAPMPPSYPFGYAPPRPTVTSAVAIVALCLFWVPVAGLVLSIIGMVKTARGKARGRGLAITALVLSILVTGAAVLMGIAIAAKPSVIDPGCIHGKTALREQSKRMDADSAKGDIKALQADIATLADDLAKDAAQSKRGDVRSALQAVHDDYAAIAAGHGDADKLNADLDQIDRLCTIGK